MAPILATAVGITPQIIDDKKLRQLRSSLLELKTEKWPQRSFSSSDEVPIPQDIDCLISLLESVQRWVFEEQVDLQEWIEPLNKIDACLSYYIEKYPSLLLIGPVKRSKSRGAVKAPIQLLSKPAESLEDLNSVPEVVNKNICTIVRFLAGILLNASNKSVFNSVEELVDLLGAADDAVAAVALEALSNLATPPSLHKQQTSDVQQHATNLHTSRTTSHKRLIALARGWGTRGSGLGLYTCSTSDDSEFGQGALPREAGELNFAFFRHGDATTEVKGPSEMTDDNCDGGGADESYLMRITLQSKEIVDGSSGMVAESSRAIEENDDTSKQKRRRVASITAGERSIRSTAELFFTCLEKAGGRDQIPHDRLFPLLADIRLTRSFHCRETRSAAIERRLRALIAVLHSHPSQEVMSGYFQAQPELCVELIDLLRPTVSSASVSASSSSDTMIGVGRSSVSRQDGISTLANSSQVPYEIRKLALETLSALVARRDGSNGALTGAARHSNVLTELGVGKGQYLGILPTLIRFSLATLGSLGSPERQIEQQQQSKSSMDFTEDAIALEVGLAFVETTAPPPLSRSVQLQRALEFIESVLTLTAAVVSTPSGTSALTECGLIPALLTNVAADNQESVDVITAGFPPADATRVKALLRFVTAQAVQILEGAIVTHGNALSAFHDLQGVEVLTTRLSKEIMRSQEERGVKITPNTDSTAMECDPPDSEAKAMDVDSSVSDKTTIHSSHRVLLFSIVTCLTVVFHQESTSSSIVTPSGATELRKPELTAALIEILENVDAYGGHLASLIATLLSDVMNSDPHVVHHVHESGLASKFIGVIHCEPNEEPTLPAVPELIMAIPNVLSAFSLTEDGATAVKEANPFPSLLRLFYHPKYAMPRSRCLLNEMTAIVGTGLDEIMRHVTSVRPLVCEAISQAMNKVAEYGDDLTKRESAASVYTGQNSSTATELENERTCLMQYVLNFGQILEQILHNEDHCEPFVAAGGLESLMKLYPLIIPNGIEFLSHVSSLSCPSISTLTHATSEDSLTLAFKCIALRYDSLKLIKTMIKQVQSEVTKLEQFQKEMRRVFPSNSYGPENDADATLILDGLPREPIYSPAQQEFGSKSIVLANYLRQVVTLQWVTNLLSIVIKASCQRSQETGTGWSRTEREWKKELSSPAFEELFGRLSFFHQTAMFEVCRIRTEDGYEERDKKRLVACKEQRLRFRLRIVCPEGAVVRDGIEIDSCASVGCMEMGEISIAFDRCVNSSGVLRYRTNRGWVSEQTRGHGREPIAEVLNVFEASEGSEIDPSEFEAKGRIEAGVPDICSTSANVLARLQTSYSDLFSALTRVIIQGVRSLPVRTISFQQGTIGSHVSAMIKILKCQISNGFNRKQIVAAVKSTESEPIIINRSGSAMYLGSLLSHLQSCLFEEKRERRMVNVPLLLSLFNAHNRLSKDSDTNSEISFFHAIVFIFKQSLSDFESRAVASAEGTSSPDVPRQMLSRTTAACLPPATSVLRRLLSGPSITSSPASSVLSRVKHTDLVLLLGLDGRSENTTGATSDDETFSPENFMRTLLCTISETVSEAWSDPRLVHSPPYITHPIASLVSDLMVGLEDATKKTGNTTTSRNPEDAGIWGPFRGLMAANRAAEAVNAPANPPEDFEPSDEAISRLEEMGFSRDHAWDAIYSTRSNVLEIAMEYALSHPPPSPSSIQRRRAEIEERRRSRGQAENPTDGSGVASGDGEARRSASSGDADTTMEVDQTNESNGTGTANEDNDSTLAKARACLDFWKKEGTKIACDVLAGTVPGGGDSSMIDATLSDTTNSQGNGELEASTVVLCSFLLDLCQKYPEERNGIASELIERLTSQFVEEEKDSGSVWNIRQGNEASFASLCHGVVLFTRALPKLRTLVLKESLVRKLLSCLESHWMSIKVPRTGGAQDAVTDWPLWLSPALLLLDIMAQPVVAFSKADLESDGSNDSETPAKNELIQVKAEHKAQAKALSQLADDLFSSLYKEKHDAERKDSVKTDVKGPTPNPANKTEADNATTTDAANLPSSQSPSSQHMFFKSVPAYFPLLPSDAAEASVDLCIRIVNDTTSTPPPGVIHAALLLLMRLLRSPRTSSYCLENGLAEKLLALPRSCRFTGHTGLVTLILRRLLEDDTSLQVAMETEIRGTINKLLGKKNGSSPSDRDKQTVPSRSFVQAITPLLCRDPSSFLKAVAVSVRFEKKGGGKPSDTKVRLLTSVERAKHVKLVHDILKKKYGSAPTIKGLSNRKPHGHRQRRGSGSNPSPRGKTPTRTNKRGTNQKKTKKERVEGKERHHDEDSKPSSTSTPPATQVTALLINCTIQRSTESSSNASTDKEATASFDFGYDDTFLWAANILEMLADLVLAIPSCATAIHRFRPSRHAKDRARQQPLAHPSHALYGCPNPPKTFVSFLLHVLLTQDRWSSRKDQQIWDRDGGEKVEESKARRNVLFRRTQVSQSAARLLVALVARPGDVRRRVISELVFALSGGELGFVTASPPPVDKFKLQPRESELHALQAWGELCVGLAAPRSNGGNYEGNSMFSFEVVKIMLEAGMAHALLLAVHRVDLHHPMSTAAIGSLILPFEILSRPSVAEVMKNLAAKEASAKEAKEASRVSKQVNSASNLVAEGEDIDHAIDDSFVSNVTEQQAERHVSEETSANDFMVADGDNDNAAEMDIEAEEEGSINGDDSEQSSSDEDDDEANDSSEDDDSDSEEESSDDSQDDDDDDDDQDGNSYESSGESIVEEAPIDEGDYRADMPNMEFDPVEDVAAGREDENGWTRIESSGFGGMLLGSRRGVGQPVGGLGAGMTARTRGFIDAAEAMISTLLRTGEIQGDALAEIEGSLGIRIVSAGGRGLAAALDGPNRGDGPFGDPFASRQVGSMSIENGRSGGSRGGRRDVVGTFPQIHQRTQPDVGYSALGGGGRWNEISSMEYVYGGPSITAGSRNYDLVSPVVSQNEEDALPTISQIEGQLFPGGPAAATHSRTQHSLHPLLCGVDLPPVNSLVSDLLPHGVRATRRGQVSTRRPGDWTSSSFSGGGFLVSTSSGNIIRSNRPQTGASMAGGRGVSGPVGWTDDGLPFDATVEEFSSAVEIALQESMEPPLVPSATDNNGGSSRTERAENQPSETAGRPNAEEDPTQAESQNANVESPRASNPNQEEQGSRDVQPSETNDGDRVASSLVAGLRLSPQSDENDGNSIPNEEQNAAPNDLPMQGSQDNNNDDEADPVEESNADNMDTDPPQEEAEQEVPPPPVNPENGDQDPANAGDSAATNEPNFNGLVCPPGIDPEVFNQLPLEMQQEVADQARTASDVAAQLDAESSLDPEALAALPESMRREVIEQEQQERRRREREQAPADPANAAEMDNASFVASLAPELRTEILMTADEAFLQSLPPNIIAEAQILRERATAHRRGFDGPGGGGNEEAAAGNNTNILQRASQGNALRDQGDGAHGSSSRRKQRGGKLRVETDRSTVVYLPPGITTLSSPVAITDLKALLRFLYLLSPVRPHRLLQKVFQNLCTNGSLRLVVSSTFVKLLQDDNKGALKSLEFLRSYYSGPEDWRSRMDEKFDDHHSDFPPPFLVGAAPDVLDTDGLNPSITLLRRKQNIDTAASIAANLPMSARGSSYEQYLPPVVATRIVDTLQQLCKSSPRFCLDMLISNVNTDDAKGESNNSTGFEMLIDLLEKPRYSKSSANLEQLLILLEYMVSPLSHLTKHGEEDIEISQKDVDSAAAVGKEWADVPRVVVSQARLQLLCSILRMETCRDTSFTKVNTIARRLCRIEANRGFVLSELASVASALGADAVRDLKALSIRLSAAATDKKAHGVKNDENDTSAESESKNVLAVSGKASSSVAVSTSTSELKLLRVLQTLQALCADTSEDNTKKNDGFFVTDELPDLLLAMNLDDLWTELTSCLKIVQILEGVNIEEDADKKAEDSNEAADDDENNSGGKKLQNSVAGLLTRFLPSIEAFFVANASATRGSENGTKEDGKANDKESQSEKQFRNLVGGAKLVEFVAANKVLLNALIRNNPGLLDKGLKALIQVPHCRHLLDFDVKRHWFKTQMRRLRQQASRRHGSLRLHIRRRHVFEDAYHQLRLRNAEEMRGRLHITFRNEEGVDAGGLSREFFGILAKEIFDPNYALFTSTEDGSTFQPNPNSSINPDHLSYFRFVGRIVGKAVSDGYLLDAHFTRSLYKHMLGIKAIDPDYYKNLKTILEYDLGDLGLDLTFSIEDHSFGRSQTLDLIPNGRDVAVTEQSKSKYVSLVCQHRMTTAISSQIKAYLDGFYELVSPDLVAIFTPRELELLISGLPDIDVNDLKQNTDYVGWKATDNQIQWFWNVLFSLTRNQKAAFLQFVTGSSKVPLAGFGELPGMRGVQKFSIHKASGSSGALMSAHTCFNSLDLPAYESEEELREKLLYAINEGGGTFLLA